LANEEDTVTVGQDLFVLAPGEFGDGKQLAPSFYYPVFLPAHALPLLLYPFAMGSSFIPPSIPFDATRLTSPTN